MGELTPKGDHVPVLLTTEYILPRSFVVKHLDTLKRINDVKTHERLEWLSRLTDKQLRALGCQRKVENWQTLNTLTLIDTLSKIEGVEVPAQA